MNKEEPNSHETITREEVHRWVSGGLSNTAEAWLCEILRGAYPLDEARSDILGFRTDTRAQPTE